MTKPKRSTEAPPVGPVDAEDDDRRLNPQADVQPQDTPASASHDEHRGLAARLLDLRKLVEDNRLLAVRDREQVLQRCANVEQLVASLTTRVDKECEAIQKQQRDLEAMLRDGGEQVRKAGELARKMTDQVKELEELREMAADPHEVVKPLRASIATLRGDLEALGRTIDIRFEQLPKARSQPTESRSEDELPIVKLGAEVRKLKDRLAALEPD